MLKRTTIALGMLVMLGLAAAPAGASSATESDAGTVTMWLDPARTLGEESAKPGDCAPVPTIAQARAANNNSGVTIGLYADTACGVLLEEVPPGGSTSPTGPVAVVGAATFQAL